MLEELEDIVTSDDTGLAGEDLASVVVSRYSAGVGSWAQLTDCAETIMYVMCRVFW